MYMSSGRTLSASVAVDQLAEKSKKANNENLGSVVKTLALSPFL